MLEVSGHKAAVVVTQVTEKRTVATESNCRARAGNHG